MGCDLPLEILSQIASHFTIDYDFTRRTPREPFPLVAPFTVVSKTWQVAFEPVIYNTLLVQSKEKVVTPRCNTGLLTWERFNEITSGAPYRVRRRAWVRRIVYCIGVPWGIMGGYNFAKLDGYTPDNYMRHENDEAFHYGMTNLFGVLGSWGRLEPGLSLNISLRVEKRNVEEPLTVYEESADTVTTEYMTGETDSVIPQRASFLPGDEGPSLVEVPIIRKVDFDRNKKFQIVDHLISVDGVMTILKSCPFLENASIKMEHFLRPDHLEALKDRRNGIAKGLLELPSALEVLRLSCDPEEPWANNMDPPYVLFDGLDTLSTNIRRISMDLVEIHLNNVRISKELFWPTDESKTENIYWPKLEVIDIKTPPFQPNGSWVFLADSDDDNMYFEHFDEETWAMNISDADAGNPRREILDLYTINALYLSASKAVRRMPRLRKFLLDISDFHASMKLSVAKIQESGKFKIEWVSCTGSQPGYRPDQEICLAWGFDPGDLEFIDDLSLDKWGDDDRITTSRALVDL
ncbi:hypothetical protein ASPWEDRAFT_38648 [Aspergillus wentii DTO 134E9]|uniref:F-box domain-containing protein n=1 Tax=Aspergillus wentii DTO 134E9 TaxID=1073089 RepID=A0A1L9RPY1_ASPWE|nr:uncharacterized protein ASPWEDRAFT_38648 [Aspergillus wentii DTO 134E9]OJJ37015.1 hypothetical protein ASPWEDRAFT_38648 [Aspergillus wentii DTO 134E9]